MSGLSKSDELKNALHKGVQSLSNIFKPVPVVSCFMEQGKLTPEEFLQAGDLLTFKCPSWKWQSGVQTGMVKYLRPERQFLITKNVPRLTSEVSEHLNEEGWVLPEYHGDSEEERIAEIESTKSILKTSEHDNNDEDDEDDNDIPDLADYCNEDNVEDQATIQGNNIQRTRTYDVSLTYDYYYQTPKVWLIGYDENGKPLSPEQVFEDISPDHAYKTVTVDTHPHLNIPSVFIHPCQHAAVMKKMVDHLVSTGKTPRVDQYLFVFLKFISSAIPEIEYDFTMEIEG